MGREFIGECTDTGGDQWENDYGAELIIKYLKQNCGTPPYGVDVVVSEEYHELGSYPVFAVVWDDFRVEYPDDYIGECMEAFELFDLPEEIYHRAIQLHDFFG